MDAETLKCACGHLFRFHFMLTINKIGNEQEVCGMCGPAGEFWIHKFQLDNLDYVEQLAKERKLI